MPALVDYPASADNGPLRDAETDVLAFAARAGEAGRSILCPRCDYDLRNIKTARCPECGERLELRLASARSRFGWVVLAVAPGCFSGVAAVFLLFPAYIIFKQKVAALEGPPWPVMVAEAFGFLSAASLLLIYRHRQRVLSWRPRRQAAFAFLIWGVHALMLAAVLVSAWLWG